MCGIAGIWNFSGPSTDTDMSDVRSMIAATLHRGPDGEGYRHMDNLALGHCRLSIIDLTNRGSQPMETGDGRALIAYNGEVYNFRELREELRQEGVTFSGECDTEVVLNALRVWGVERATRRFNGMFAFAYYDTEERTLWLVRDRMGIKTLSIARYGDRLFFCSEDKGILALDAFPSDISEREVTLLLADQVSDSQVSLFRRIRRLPPGGCWKITEKGIEESRYWDALEAVDPDRLEAGSHGKVDPLEDLETILTRSIALHCVSDAPLATACSGGIDSGLVTKLAKTVIDNYCGYVVDPDTGHSEAEAALRTGRKAGVEIRRVRMDRENYLRNLPKSIHALETDGRYESTPALLALTEQCHEDGIKVLLTGEGSDELLGGYSWHRTSARLWRKLDPPRSLLLRRTRRRHIYERLRQTPFSTSIGSSSASERIALTRSLSPGMNFLHTRIFDHLAPVRSHQARAFAGAGILDLYMHLQNLLHRHDRLSMAASVELRVPFIENDLIDFSLHLHPRFKYRRGISKWLLREIAAPHLPPENVKAPKIGFGLTTSYTLGCEAILSNGYLGQVMGWTRQEEDSLMEICRRHAKSRIRLVSLEMLIRQYCGGESGDTLAERLIGMNADAARRPR